MHRFTSMGHQRIGQTSLMKIKRLNRHQQWTSTRPSTKAYLSKFSNPMGARSVILMTFDLSAMSP